MISVGIMGGTFNPIHNGHLIIANEVLNQLNIDKIFFIPVGIPPHKNLDEVVSADDRFKMVELAVKKNNKFEALDIEIKRPGFTYTIDTLKTLNEIYKNYKFYFIIGFDTLKELHTWKQIEEIYKYCSFVVVNRNSDKKNIVDLIKHYNNLYGLQIEYVNIPNIEISSSSIRDKIKNNRSIKYYVPDAVEEYIIAKNLYRKNIEKEEIINYIKHNLDEKRYRHSINVSKMAIKLAQKYNVDKEKVEIAAILHDVAKNLNLEDMLRYIKEFGINLNEVDIKSPQILHSYIGAYIAREKFKVDDDVFNAIYYHTVGRKDMSMIEKIIFIADVIEEERNFEGVEEIRKQAFEDIDLAIIKSCDSTIKYLIEKGLLIHPNTIELRNSLLDMGE
ncbi:MAG: nicotinate-nucleotide adenylyltransferase [Caloramator sp.]|nr:nicotinate-nucleotide adenylyltransferase [Caloramator sp.]